MVENQSDIGLDFYVDGSHTGDVPCMSARCFPLKTGEHRTEYGGRRSRVIPLCSRSVCPLVGNEGNRLSGRLSLLWKRRCCRIGGRQPPDA